MCHQSFNPHAPSVQYIDDPVQDREVIICSNFYGEILFHNFVGLGASNNISPTPAPVGTIGKTFSSFSTCTSSKYGPVHSSISFRAFRNSCRTETFFAGMLYASAKAVKFGLSSSVNE